MWGVIKTSISAAAANKGNKNLKKKLNDCDNSFFTSMFFFEKIFSIINLPIFIPIAPAIIKTGISKTPWGKMPAKNLRGEMVSESKKANIPITSPLEKTDKKGKTPKNTPNKIVKIADVVLFKKI